MDDNYAYIKYTGTADVHQITTALGIQPTKAWNVGDARGNGTKYEHSHWSYESTSFKKGVLDESLEAVLSFVESNKAGFQNIPDHFSPTLQCVGHHEKESLGFHLSKELIQRLGELGWAVDFDLYCDAGVPG